MLKDRILATLHFFDLQDMPLTLLELDKYLLAEPQGLSGLLDKNWDLQAGQMPHSNNSVTPISAILNCLEQDLAGRVENISGFYCLAGKKNIVALRQANYFYGIKRERLIRRFAWPLKYIPFLRAVAISGSQALGQQKPTSDIDLFVITDPKYLWIARTLVTGYFQIIGKRRHSKKVTNRFCLNHYLAGVKILQSHRDLYNAMEYLRFRPLFGFTLFEEFYAQNLSWLHEYFPNFQAPTQIKNQSSKLQSALEKIFSNSLGSWLNEVLGHWQLSRIKKGEFVVADYTELAFHSLVRKRALLGRFFQFEQQNNRETVQAVV